LLERLNSEEYTVHPDLLSKEQTEQIVSQICELLCKDLPLKKMEAAMRRLQHLLYEQGYIQRVNREIERELSAGKQATEMPDTARPFLARPNSDFTQRDDATPAPHRWGNSTDDDATLSDCDDATCDDWRNLE
jgi:hypothetical protein